MLVLIFEKFSDLILITIDWRDMLMINLRQTFESTSKLRDFNLNVNNLPLFDASNCIVGESGK